ncbi:glutaredoxin [Plesiocystis pacifica SIR-1]|uniref:Glutaredoxin n=1 Tax=Plesiocystis pacifica SIR-1 TaxID=391625 RepID=A6GBX2_9BACT|nr:hypothetical protein [Plesiocystis pacifica]EDM76645.1 glutaredoxin [Plesiocystis pacifica SIR-1]
MADSNSPRPVHPSDACSETVRRQQAAFHPDVLEAVINAVNSQDVVVVGMATNPHVKKARLGLRNADIPFTYLEYGSYTKGWRQRLAIKMWSGYPTFPQVFVKGTLVGGNAELQGMLSDGSLAAQLAG